LKILSITAGAANMYCGSCLRDNALAAELIRQGHHVILQPLYTPTRTDEPNVSRAGVFFGGISVYLEQKWRLFQWTPKFLDKLWDLGPVIRMFAGRGVTVNPGDLGALTVSILEGSNGRQRKEVNNLAAWVRSETPDIVTLPYTLLISLARPLKEAARCPVVCTLQGEELFLDGLAEPWRERALNLIRRQVDSVDAFIAVSQHEARHMSAYLRIPEHRIHTVPLGINLEGYGLERRSRAAAYNIGYLGRLAPEKGLHLLIDAYRLLRQRSAGRACALEVAGYLAPENRRYLESIRTKMREWRLESEFHYRGELDRAQKARFLQNIDVFSLPCTYDEPKGIPVLEAMANGVPVVQPRRGSFPEMVEATGGGLLVEPDSAAALAAGLRAVMDDTSLALQLGRAGYEAVHRDWHIGRMAQRTVAVYQTALSAVRARQPV
jgi:glycosyltransferase involved in cell wall biosynthesis